MKTRKSLTSSQLPKETMEVPTEVNSGKVNFSSECCDAKPVCNPSALEVATRGSGVPDQPGLPHENLHLKRQDKRNFRKELNPACQGIGSGRLSAQRLPNSKHCLRDVRRRETNFCKGWEGHIHSNLSSKGHLADLLTC